MLIDVVVHGHLPRLCVVTFDTIEMHNDVVPGVVYIDVMLSVK